LDTLWLVELQLAKTNSSPWMPTEPMFGFRNYLLRQQLLCYLLSDCSIILIPVRIKNCYLNVQLSTGWGVLLNFFKMFRFLLWFINRNEVASLQWHGPAVSSSVWSLVASEDWNCMIAGLFNSENKSLCVFSSFQKLHNL
jgi:hypothetical protein